MFASVEGVFLLPPDKHTNNLLLRSEEYNQNGELSQGGSTKPLFEEANRSSNDDLAATCAAEFIVIDVAAMSASANVYRQCGMLISTGSPS
jgi:hypothetical protein